MNSIKKIMRGSDYDDIDLDKFALENSNNTTYTYKETEISTYNQHFPPVHPKINFVFSKDGNTYQVVTAKTVDKQEDEAEIKSILRTNKITALYIKSHYIRGAYENGKIYMDFFNSDLANKIDSRKGGRVDVKGVEDIAIFLVRALTYIKLDGYCYTDIKTDQVLLRPYNSKRGSYYYVIEYEGSSYEIALADLDFKKCHDPDYLLTYEYPEFYALPKKEKDDAENQLLWSFGITLMDLYGINISAMHDRKTLTRNVVNEYKAEVSRNSKMSKDVKQVILESLEPLGRKWMDVTKELFIQ